MKTTLRAAGARPCRHVILGLALASVVAGAQADLRLPTLFSDHMVVQGGAPVPVWGTADAGAEVRVEWRGEACTARADADGAWRVTLPASAPGGPFELTVACGDERRAIADVLVGEVWLCSGQSNMEMHVADSANAEAERRGATHPQIRMFTVPRRLMATPQKQCEGRWIVCSPETVGDFSAAGYFFGRMLHQELKAPVGLIHSSVGGTRIESWIDRAGHLSHPVFAKRVQEMDAAVREYEAVTDEQRRAQLAAREAAYADECDRYWVAINDVEPGVAQGWARAELDDSGWAEFPLSNTWERSGVEALREFDGCVWLRTTVTIPDSWAGRDVVLRLPPIDDSDQTYFNGRPVGSMLGAWNRTRAYPIPGDAVKPGRATIAIRVVDYGWGGGLNGPPDVLRKQMRLESGSESAIALDQPWKFQISTPNSALPTPPQKPSMPEHPAASWTSPAALYNGMIAPLVPYAMRGVIWYQGEANTRRPDEYRELLPLLMRSWRTAWNQPGTFRDLPFGVVQLANYMDPTPDEPGRGEWPWLREVQLQTTLADKHSGLAVAIDIGEARDIHPKNKQEVGRRLVLWALAKVYGKDVAYSGPVYRSMSRRGSEIVIEFDHADGLKTRDGRPPASVAIAGEDRKFIWADARIEGDALVVSAEGVATPVAVRYAWADNPDMANLINADGLPASPFRTDDWAE